MTEAGVYGGDFGFPDVSGDSPEFWDAERLEVQAVNFSLADLINYLDVERRQKQLRTMSYQNYLLSDHWRATRRVALQRAGYRCERCSKTTKLNVHHRSYERLGAEDDADLEVLCRRCHAREHHIAEINEETA